MNNLSYKERIALVRKYYIKKGYRVHSGLQFGCELVLYADTPNRVHSDFCVHVPPNNEDARLNWMTIQVLARSMPDLHKTLIVAVLKECSSPADHHPDAVYYNYTSSCTEEEGEGNENDSPNNDSMKTKYFTVDEIAIATEHAPFRHKNVSKEVGMQVKKQKT